MDPIVQVAFLALVGTIATVAGSVAVAIITSNRGAKVATETSVDKAIEDGVQKELQKDRYQRVLRENARLTEENRDLRDEVRRLRLIVGRRRTQ